MNAGVLARCAGQLFEAERCCVAIPPISAQEPALSIHDAYAIQMRNVARRISLGQAVSGKKIGITSPAMQQLLGVKEPDYGHLFDAMRCEDGVIETAGLIQPKIEAELAFVLSADLSGEHITADDVRAATDYVVCAFEIIDSRVADWRIQLTDTVADNASAARYLLGNTRLRVDATDLSEVEMRLFKNGDLAACGNGAAVLGNPCNAVAWLANRLSTYGITLKQGEVILSGALSAAPAAHRGDVFRAEFSSFGRIEARFA